jgi:hypothetical protein
MPISQIPISGFFGILDFFFFLIRSPWGDRMSGRRHLRSQGQIEPGVNLDDLIVHTRALRRLRCELFQALPPIHPPPLGARARRLASSGGIKRDSEDLLASFPPSTKSPYLGTRISFPDKHEQS